MADIQIGLDAYKAPIEEQQKQLKAAPMSPIPGGAAAPTPTLPAGR